MQIKGCKRNPFTTLPRFSKEMWVIRFMSRTKEITSHLKTRKVIVGKKPGKPVLKNTEEKKIFIKLVQSQCVYNYPDDDAH